MSDAERTNPYISFAIKLEQALMVGSYDKVRLGWRALLHGLIVGKESALHFHSS
jgi:hypothetical protein